MNLGPKGARILAQNIFISFEDVVQLPGNSVTDDAMRALGITMAYSHVYSSIGEKMFTVGDFPHPQYQMGTHP